MKRKLAFLALAGLLAWGTGLTQTMTPIAKPTSTITYGFPFNFSHRIAVTDNGWFWVMVFKKEQNKPTDLVLYASPNRGKSWVTLPTASTPTTNDFAYGGLAVGTDCKTLHAAWTAKDPTNNGWSVFYQAFDSVKMQWIGKPLEIAKAAGSGSMQAQYRYQDINVSPKGRVVISVLGHRNCPSPYNGNWHVCMYVLQPGKTAFDKPFRFDQSTTGQSAEVCLHGEVIFSTMKGTTGKYQVSFRAYDMDTKTFIAPWTHVGGTAAGDPAEATRNSVMLADEKGNLYVFYGIGNRYTAGKGELKVAYAAAGAYTKWTRQTVAADPSLRGSKSYIHFGLTLLPGNTVMLVYSKYTETYKNLYFRLMRDGKFLTSESSLLKTSISNRFAGLVVLKNHALRTGLYALVKNRDGSLPGTEVDFLTNAGTAGFSRYYGHGCLGKAKAEPRLVPQVLPEAGKLFTLGLEGQASNSSGILLIGLKCQPKPLDLTFLGAPGCAVFQDLILGMAVPTSSAGTAKIPFNLPPSTAGGKIRFQSAAIVPGANAANLLTSRSLIIYP